VEKKVHLGADEKKRCMCQRWGGEPRGGPFQLRTKCLLLARRDVGKGEREVFEGKEHMRSEGGDGPGYFNLSGGERQW